MSLIHVL